MRNALELKLLLGQPNAQANKKPLCSGLWGDRWLNIHISLRNGLSESGFLPLVPLYSGQSCLNMSRIRLPPILWGNMTSTGNALAPTSAQKAISGRKQHKLTEYLYFSTQLHNQTPVTQTSFHPSVGYIQWVLARGIRPHECRIWQSLPLTKQPKHRSRSTIPKFSPLPRRLRDCASQGRWSIHQRPLRSASGGGEPG